MPFKKGKSGNPEGRNKGAKNRTTEEVRQSLLRLLDDNLDKLQEDIDNLKGKDRVSLLINLAKHIVPQAINPEKLTEDQLQQIISYLRENEKQS